MTTKGSTVALTAPRVSSCRSCWKCGNEANSATDSPVTRQRLVEGRCNKSRCIVVT